MSVTVPASQITAGLDCGGRTAVVAASCGSVSFELLILVLARPALDSFAALVLLGNAPDCPLCAVACPQWTLCREMPMRRARKTCTYAPTPGFRAINCA